MKQKDENKAAAAKPAHVLDEHLDPDMAPEAPFAILEVPRAVFIDISPRQECFHTTEELVSPAPPA